MTQQFCPLTVKIRITARRCPIAARRCPVCPGTIRSRSRILFAACRAGTASRSFHCIQQHINGTRKVKIPAQACPIEPQLCQEIYPHHCCCSQQDDAKGQERKGHPQYAVQSSTCRSSDSKIQSLTWPRLPGNGQIDNSNTFCNSDKHKENQNQSAYRKQKVAYTQIEAVQKSQGDRPEQ